MTTMPRIAPPTLPSRPASYARPALTRFGTFRELTAQGFSGNLDGGLILGPDGSTTPATDPALSGSR